jgi:hypothetical protein
MLLGEDNQWPRILEQRLEKVKGTNVWVGNAGHSGFGSDKVLEVARNYLPIINPKYLIVLTGFNEGIVPEDLALSDLPEKAPPLANRLVVLADRIVLIKLLRRTLFSYSALSPHDIYFGESNIGIVKFRQQYQLDAQLTPPRQRDWHDLDLSKFDQALQEIGNLAKQYGARLILCTQPTLYRDDLTPGENQLLWMIGNYTPATKRKKMDLINSHIRAAAARLGVPLVDLDRDLPRTTDVFYDDCHFNIGGAQRVAEAVFQCLMASGLGETNALAPQAH